jgi:MFS family permease
MLAGMASNKLSRIWVMAGSSVLWSLAILATGFANNYVTVVIYIMVIGFACGFFVPPAISLIIDYFPAERQTTAMAVFAIAEQIAAAMVSLVTVIVSVLGWRQTYLISGAMFVGFSILAFALIREPIKQRFTFMKKDDSTEN